MSQLKWIKNEIETVNNFKNLSDIYGEIASIRMMKIRESVLKNRDYIFSITQIFYEALASFLRKTTKISLNKKFLKKNRITFLSHNGKMVFVLISANTGFYGDVVTKTFNKFVNELKTSDAEVTIIGKIGKKIFSENFPKRPFTFFELPDYGSDKNKLLAIINHLVQYDEVRVYYSAYDTVINQRPLMSNLTAGTTLIQKAEKSKEEFIFEPSVEEILMFFEKEVFGSFFDQTIKENQLSKLSGRIMAMDRASLSIKNRIKEINFDYLKIRHREMNKKQLSLLQSLVYH
ncbi:MAG: F0F1 ATP synthase subunit gamma [Patescibacteria group bacterium]